MKMVKREAVVKATSYLNVFEFHKQLGQWEAFSKRAPQHLVVLRYLAVKHATYIALMLWNALRRKSNQFHAT